MSGKKEKDKKPLPLSIYWRLLAYVKPYKWRLTVGILAGLVASGSMFGGIMVIPQLVKGVDVVTPESSIWTRTSERRGGCSPPWGWKNRSGSPWTSGICGDGITRG